MQTWKRWVLLMLVAGMAVCLVACEKPKKEGKLVVSEQKFLVRADESNAYTGKTQPVMIDAKGKIRNVGEVDVKNVVVTGYCRSCDEIWVPGKWFVSDVEKVAEQKDTINYIAVGEEKAFAFARVADMLLKDGQEMPALPEGLEIVIESFDVVD